MKACTSFTCTSVTLRAALAALTAAASLAVSAPASAQFAKPETAIKYRQSALTLLASHFGRMDGVVKGQVPYDADAIKQNVAIVSMLAQLPWAAFGEGTEGGGARPEVWSKREGFDAAQVRLKDAVAELSAAADTGDLSKLRAAFGKVGASCKACHDNYRKR